MNERSLIQGYVNKCVDSDIFPRDSQARTYYIEPLWLYKIPTE